MKKLVILMISFSCVLVIQSQEKKEKLSNDKIKIITKENIPKRETIEERRKRYIEEGNPFKEYGYKPKILTLSNGKYKEFFTDSIIQIGSFVFNRDSRQITGVKILENKGISEATLKPDIVSRWMSPDPLSDEFPNWSPYNFVENNPIRFVDPLGLAPEDVVILGKDADAAFEQLQASTSLTLTRNKKTGKVSSTGEAKTDADKKLQEAITDTSVQVTINTTDKNYAITSDGVSRTFDGDAFLGSTVNENGVVVTNQLLNTDTAKKIDDAQNGAEGTVAKHAVLESFIAAKENPGSGDAVANPAARNSAHNQANALDSNVNVNNSIIQTQIKGGRKSRINITGKGKRTTLFSVKLKKLGKK